MEPLDTPGPRPPGTHWDPYKHKWVPNLTEDEVMSMWPNAVVSTPVVPTTEPTLSTKKQWREEDRITAEEVMRLQREALPFRFPLEAMVFTDKGELLDVPEVPPRKMIGPQDNSLPPELLVEEQAYVNEAVSQALRGELKIKSDGGSTDYYAIPANAKDLQDLIEFKRMEFGMANIFKACYRWGEKSGTDKLYDINKIIWFAQREKARLEAGA